MQKPMVQLAVRRLDSTYRLPFQSREPLAALMCIKAIVAEYSQAPAYFSLIPQIGEKKSLIHIKSWTVIVFRLPCVTLFLMKIPIELTEESRDLLLRHFKERSALHEILDRATRTEVAGVTVYVFECEPRQAEVLLDMARDHCPPAVKDIEHAIFAATAG